MIADANLSDYYCYLPQTDTEMRLLKQWRKKFFMTIKGTKAAQGILTNEKRVGNMVQWFIVAYERDARFWLHKYLQDNSPEKYIELRTKESIAEENN